MLLKLALKNLIQKKGRSLLALTVIAIAAAVTLLFLSLKHGIENATFEELEKQNPLNQITVRPNLEKTGVISFLAQGSGVKLTEQDLQKIQQINGIHKIYPEIQYNHFASIEAGLFDFSLVTDAMIFGVPAEFLNLKEEEWSALSQPYPAVIPTKILDLFNLAIAAPQGLPLLGEKDLIGKTITFYPTYSNFFPSSTKTDPIQLKIIALSDKVNLIGATIPYQVVEELNKKYAGTSENTYLELFIEVENPAEIKNIAEEIENLGYTTEYFQKNLEDIQAKLVYLNISLGLITAIILLISGLAIISVFLATIAERIKEIGLLRALGATKNHIRNLILMEAGILGIFGSLIGLAIGELTIFTIQKVGLQNLSELSLSTEKIFLINLQVIAFAILFSTILTIISAMFPAIKASNIDPIRALSK